jgi:hypothetical protein
MIPRNASDCRTMSGSGSNPDHLAGALCPLSPAAAAFDARIRANLSGNARTIASALITGRRDAISPAVNDATYVSSVLSV